MRKHDIVGKGFDVDPELLVHDLVMLELSKTDLSQLDEWKIYDLYCETLSKYEDVIADKTRYDSVASK